MKKAQVPSEKTKKGLWAQAVEATPTVQIFIPEELCWEFQEDKASILLQDPCPITNFVYISGYTAYYTYSLLICPLTIKINLSLHSLIMIVNWQLSSVKLVWDQLQPLSVPLECAPILSQYQMKIMALLDQNWTADNSPRIGIDSLAVLKRLFGAACKNLGCRSKERYA